MQRGRTPASIAARLTYDNVTHRYGDVTAVRDFSLDIEPGEIVCLLGRSGCGKTTLLRLAAGVEEPSAGPHPDQRPRSLRRRRVFCRRSARRRADVPGLRAVSASDQSRQRDVRTEGVAARRCRARGAARARARRSRRISPNAYPHMLSGGEQQRVALARAVAPRPSVLLMDEPFSGLDRRLRDEVRDDTLNVLRESRVTCVDRHARSGRSVAHGRSHRADA